MDSVFKNLTRTFAFLVFMLLGAIMVSLLYGSRESIATHGIAFLWTNNWDPVQNIYGAMVPIVGTLLTSAIALLIAVPVSFGIAMRSEEHTSELQSLMRTSYADYCLKKKHKTHILRIYKI